MEEFFGSLSGGTSSGNNNIDSNANKRRSNAFVYGTGMVTARRVDSIVDSRSSETVLAQFTVDPQRRVLRDPNVAVKIIFTDRIV